MITLESLRSQCCNDELVPGNFVIVSGIPGRFVKWEGKHCRVELSIDGNLVNKTVHWDSVRRYITDNELRALFM